MSKPLEGQQRQILTVTETQHKLVGGPKPLWQMPGKRGVSLLEWKKIYEGIPVYNFQETTAPLSTVKHAHKRLVKFGLIEEGEYVIRIRGSKKEKHPRVFIIRLPQDAHERQHILRDIDSQKSLGWLKTKAKK